MVLECIKNVASIVMNAIILLKIIMPTIFMTRLSNDILDDTCLITDDDKHAC
jgi:hypothetical protein